MYYILKQHSCFDILLFWTGIYARPSNYCVTAYAVLGQKCLETPAYTLLQLFG